MGNGSGWTDERVETLKTMWADGSSCGEIAKHLGGVTRNAVVGKIHRLGIQRRSAVVRETQRIKRAGARMARKREPRADIAKAVAYAAPLAALSRPLPMFEEPGDASSLAPLPETERTCGDHYCRWPIGDPLDPAFGFCGRDQAWASETRRDCYCAAHRAAERQRRREPRSSVEQLYASAKRAELTRFSGLPAATLRDFA